MVVSVLDECHKTFVSCFHAFYPTGQLKWACLCDLLLSRDAVSKVSIEYAVLNPLTPNRRTVRRYKKSLGCRTDVLYVVTKKFM